MRDWQESRRDPPHRDTVTLVPDQAKQRPGRRRTVTIDQATAAAHNRACSQFGSRNTLKERIAL